MTVSREDILTVLGEKKLPSPPAFSGLIHVTLEGLASEGLSLAEAHRDARKMSRAAASTFKMCGIPSATLPLDLCAPAEALGAELNFFEDEVIQFPQVKFPLMESAKGIRDLNIGDVEAGRLPIIYEAIQMLKTGNPSGFAISGMIPGPYTLLLYLCNAKNLFIEMKRESHVVLDALLHLASFLSAVGNAYRQAGADFITIHEMGGSPGFIGPAKFEQFVLPALQTLHASLPAPRVLSVCGNTNKSMAVLAGSGVEAISVDQTNDLVTSRASLKNVMLFGNIDPVATLYRGDEAQVVDAVHRTMESGVDAVWPGCDLVPQTSLRNIKAFIHHDFSTD